MVYPALVRNMGAEFMLTVDSLADWLRARLASQPLPVPALGEGYGRSLPADVDVVSSNATVLTTASRMSEGDLNDT